MIFRRLNATPDQERALGETFEGLRSALRSAREAAGRSRSDLATALRQGEVDVTKLGDLIARFDGASMAVREALTSALFKAHEVLDERQRRELADLLEGGFFRRGGPWGRPGGPERGDGRDERQGAHERHRGDDRRRGDGGAGGPSQAGGTGSASGSGKVGGSGDVSGSGHVGGASGDVSGSGKVGGTEEGGAS
jgi:uncharacterized membrane protein